MSSLLARRKLVSQYCYSGQRRFSHYDTQNVVAIVGLGVMGTFSLWQCTSAGIPCIAFEQFDSIHHGKGSSHGRSRIFRVPYFEHPSYVEWTKQSLSMWKELQSRDPSKVFFHQCGSLEISPTISSLKGHLNNSPDVTTIVRKSLHSCKIHNIKYDFLCSSDDIRKRFPAFAHIQDGFEGLYQRDGALIDAEYAMDAALNQAKKTGLASLHFDTKITSIEKSSSDEKIHIQTNKGHSYKVDKLIITAGPWTKKISLLDSIQKIQLQPERQVIGWFGNKDSNIMSSFHKEKLPVFIVEDFNLKEWYGFPLHESNHSYKVGLYNHLKESVDPDHVMEPVEADSKALSEFARMFTPQLFTESYHEGPFQKCIFTNSQDGHFVIGNDGNILFMCGFSGHGFKFAPSVGKVALDFVKTKSLKIPDLFRCNRFSSSSPS